MFKKSIMKSSCFEHDLQPDYSICVECKKDSIIEDRSSGSVVCTECGLVQSSQLISEDEEWRSFGEDMHEDLMKSRVGVPETSLDVRVGLSTNISSIDGNQNKSLEKLQDKSSSGANLSGLFLGFRRIQQLCSSLSLPHLVLHCTKELYQRVRDCKKSFRKQHTDVIILTCIYIVCRQQQIPRTFSELSSACLDNSNVKALQRCFNKMKKFRLYIKKNTRTKEMETKNNN